MASARCAIHVGGLQHLSDYISQKSGVSKGHTRRLGQLLPSYLLALLSWSESEEDVQGSGEPPEGHNSRGKGRGRKDNCKGQGKDDPFKAFVRTKLNRISQIFQSSKYIADSTPLVASNAEIPGAQAAYSNDREIVGETSGQLIFSTAPTANHSSNRVLRTSLIRQMERLEGNFRLIAGPLEDGEEMADAFEVQGGDSLTRLREKLSSGNYSVGRISLDSFDPDEFEKEEKMNFVVTDYIDETEATIGGVNVKTEEKQRTRREIPTIRLTVSEGHALKSEIRESCGEDSPVSHLSVKALIDLLSSAKCDIDASADNNFDTEERDFGTKMKSSTGVEIANARRSRRYDTDPSKGGFVLATQSDERIKQSSSTNSDDTVSDSSDSNICIIVNGSSGVDTGNSLDGGVTASSSSWVSRPESLTSQDSTPFTVKLADQEPASLSVPPSPFLADFLVLQSALRSPGAHASPTECPIDLSRESRDANAGSTPARKAGVIGVGAADDNIIFVNEKRNRVKMLGGREKITPLETTQTLTTGQSDLQKVAEDPAALHRKKVKMRLAALSSTTRKSVGDGDNAQATVKRRLTASSTVSQRSLLEEQTDTLARLVEQRIHDRWLEAAKPLHQLPRSFR